MTLGRAVRTRELGRFRVADSCYAPNQVLAPHAHGHPSLTIVRQGEFCERTDDGEFACVPGSVLFTPAARSHSNDAGPGGTRSLIVETEALPAELGLPDRGVTLTGTSVAKLAAAADRELGRDDQAAWLALEGILLQLFACVARAEVNQPRRRSPTWLVAVLAHLDANYLQPISAAQLAEVAGVHPVHVARTFRRHLRCAPRDYQQRLRVQHAARLLAATRDRVAQIAVACGFADHAHFSRAFKQHTGQTPSEFRHRAG
ncbi:MAG: helix-turn-helix domain-containing protein [Planctomycetota bacterium]